MIIDSPKSLGSTIFCDDIRHEVSGKVTLVGVYDVEMQIQSEFPVVIPQLCLAVSFRDDPDRIASEDLIYRIVKSTHEKEDVLFESKYTAPKTEVKTLSENREIGRRDGERFAAIKLYASLSPFLVDEECLIKTRIYRGGDEYLCGALRVVQTDEIRTKRED